MEAAAYPDWSGLPEDLIALVMRAVDIPDLFRSGAVCTSWRAAYAGVRPARVPATDSSQCLLYSCAADDPDIATIYSTSDGAVFKVRLPDPAVRSCYFLGSDHGWVFLADEESNLHLVNPLTSAHVDLPPVTGFYNVESFIDDRGRPMYNAYIRYYNPEPWVHEPNELRFFFYERAYLTCSPLAGAVCVALIVHRPWGQLSFARIGDNQWTHITRSESVEQDLDYIGAAYNHNDGLFYLLDGDASIFTLDLNGTAPIVKKILQGNAKDRDPVRSIVLAPWGDLLQVWRIFETDEDGGQIPAEVAHEVINPKQVLYTEEIELYKADFDHQKLLKIGSSELQGHALFLGFNLTIVLSSPGLKPNHAYITEHYSEHITINRYARKEIGIWNFITNTLESLGNVQSTHPCLNWPSPIWFTPSLS